METWVERFLRHKCKRPYVELANHFTWDYRLLTKASREKLIWDGRPSYFKKQFGFVLAHLPWEVFEVFYTTRKGWPICLTDRKNVTHAGKGITRDGLCFGGVVILNVDMVYWYSDERVRGVIAHELAHAYEFYFKLVVDGYPEQSVVQRERTANGIAEDWGFNKEIEALDFQYDLYEDR